MLLQTFTFSTLDLLLLIPLAWSAYHGYRKGFTLELILTLGLIAGVFAGFYFLDVFVQGISPIVKGNIRVVLPVVGFISICLTVWVLGKYVANYASRMVSGTLFGTADGAIGALVGAAKTFFVFGSMLWLVEVSGLQVPIDFVHGSMLYPMVRSSGPVLFSTLSEIVPYLAEFKASVEAALANYVS